MALIIHNFDFQEREKVVKKDQSSPEIARKGKFEPEIELAFEDFEFQQDHSNF